MIDKKFVGISITKIMLYTLILILGCVSETRLQNLRFIILLGILVVIQVIKIVFQLLSNVKNKVRINILIASWLIELIMLSTFFTLLYSLIGFDIYDIMGAFVGFVIISSTIVESYELLRFINRFLDL